MPAVDLSLTTLFLQATGVVQAVLALLLLCSVFCWAIILDKAIALFRLSAQARTFEGAAAAERTESPWPAGVVRRMIDCGRREGDFRQAGESLADRRDRIERVMREVLLTELARVERRLPYLATIGSSAPFIGLFGTVWGIMHAFAAIASANDTSLAVVAPGIAEALSTTAVGLAAAIPASIAYNKLAGDFGALSRRFGLAIGAAVRRMERTGGPA